VTETIGNAAEPASEQPDIRHTSDITGDLAWQDFANCRGADADLFFTERGASTRKAKAICDACEVRAECLDYAITTGEKYGIWGGLSERARRRVRHERSQQMRQVAVLDQLANVDLLTAPIWVVGQFEK
jgi:WhiB family redox-sensing transcriptional regulator